MSQSKLLVDIPNPFSDGIVRIPWEFDPGRTPDIPSIHANAYGVCLRLLDQDVRRNGQSSLLIDGPAGIGKTHLIARLARRAQSGELAGLLCYVSLDDVAPQTMWTHLRRCVAGDLLMRAGRDGRSGLERLLELRMSGLLTVAAPRGQSSLVDWVCNVFAAPRKSQIRERIQKDLFDQVRLDMEVRTALVKLFHEDPEQAQLARDWLLGERLTDDQLRQLNLSVGDLSDQVRELQACAVTLSLLRLATDALPIVLCFDQVENLVHTLTDRTGFVRFGQMVTKIRHDISKGVLLVSFLRSDLVQNLKDALGLAGWARVAENRVNLSPLTWYEAHQLVLQRMNAVEPLRQLRKGMADEYWPLDKQRLQEIYHRLRLTCTPRELLWECKNLFGKPETLLGLHGYLLLKWQQLCQQKLTDAGADRLLHALNGVPWLAELLGCNSVKVDLADLNDYLPDANLFLQLSDGGRIAFSACPRTPYLWRRLDRLSKAWQTRLPKLDCRRLILLCDAQTENLPPATRTRMMAIQKLVGISAVCPAREHLVGLDGLHCLLTESHKGDLVYEGRPVEARALQGWAAKSLVAPGHELGVLRLLYDELGLDLPVRPATGQTTTAPALVGNG
jgi:hypothetical protein